MGDEETALLRRELDRQHFERLAELEAQLDALEMQVRNDIAIMKMDMHSMKLDIKAMLSCQSEHQPTMQSLERIVGAGMVLRWIVIFTVGALAAIGTTATAWETVSRWFK